VRSPDLSSPSPSTSGSSILECLPFAEGSACVGHAYGTARPCGERKERCFWLSHRTCASLPGVLPLVRVESSSAPPLQCARRLLDSIESGGHGPAQNRFLRFLTESVAQLAQMEVVLERKIALGMMRSWVAVSSSRHHVVRQIQYQMHVLPNDSRAARE
jgi:hypothetical protein